MVTVKKETLGLDGRSELDLEGWLQHIGDGRGREEMAMIRRACEIAERAHADQRRASGEPYLVHCLSVADILAGLRLDSETVCAGILHDVVEDTEVTLDDVTAALGPNVARLVDGVTKMRRLPGWQGTRDEDKQKRYAESLRKMFLAMAEDVRVVLIKLADRVHNMRTLGSLPEDKQKRIARETLEIVAPLANRLGIWQLKWELEDLSFKYLDPERYRQIAAMLDERRVDRQRYVANVSAILKEELKKAGIEAEVYGRAKHIYSIWRKMEDKHLDFTRIFDVRALRVIVDNVAQCYAALGIVHSLWPYVPGEFDDYIATPKDNHYRSLHTAVVGPERKTLEVQIRTHEMNQHAELGVAAHWRYKEGSKSEAAFDRKVAWLRQLLDWKEQVADAADFVDQVKEDMAADRVYVLTPAGNVIDLPRGSSPVDFAYHIHTEIGHRCRGAEVNGRIVPLNYALQSGDQVKILTVKQGAPSRDWLNPHLGYIHTSKARSRVQQWFKQQNFENNVVEGRRVLEKELVRLGVGDVNYERLAHQFKYAKLEDFLAAVGRNDIKVSQIVAALQEAVTPPEEPIPTLVKPQPLPEGRNDVQVRGVGDLLTHMARCCRPVPGDPIIGYITRGHGVTIHRQDCQNILRYHETGAERLIEVDWSGRAGNTYPVDIHIEAFDRAGLLRDVTSVVANENLNVIAANTVTNRKTHRAHILLRLEIPGIEILSRVLAKISQLPNVLEAQRRIS